MLTSSVSPSVSLHFCAGEIQNVAIFGKAQSCKTDNNCDHGKRKNHTSLQQRGCCEDAMAICMLDEYSYAAKEKITIEVTQSFLIPPVSLIENANSCKAIDDIHHRSYKPPLIDRDITILIQTFLI
ncbi:MAG TPA: hypothetical protein VIH22_07410 [Cyclobacteriaceae bacterium]